MSSAMRCVQIRSYEIKAGQAARFEAIFGQEVLPLLSRWHTRIVHAGWSLDEPNRFVLMREYDDLDELRRSQDAFYSSAEWREGPRQAMLEQIEYYVSIVVELSSDCVGRIGQELAGTGLADHAESHA